MVYLGDETLLIGSIPKVNKSDDDVSSSFLPPPEWFVWVCGVSATECTVVDGKNDGNMGREVRFRCDEGGSNGLTSNGFPSVSGLFAPMWEGDIQYKRAGTATATVPKMIPAKYVPVEGADRRCQTDKISHRYCIARV